MFKNLIIKIRRSFGLFTIGEVLHEIKNIGHCRDREDFEWKVEMKLKQLGEKNART